MLRLATYVLDRGRVVLVSSLRFVDVWGRTAHVDASVQVVVLVLQLVAVHGHLTYALEVALRSCVSCSYAGRAFGWHLGNVARVKGASTWSLRQDVILLPSLTIIWVFVISTIMLLFHFDLGWSSSLYTIVGLNSCWRPWTGPFGNNSGVNIIGVIESTKFVFAFPRRSSLLSLQVFKRFFQARSDSVWISGLYESYGLLQLVILVLAHPAILGIGVLNPVGIIENVVIFVMMQIIRVGILPAIRLLVRVISPPVLFHPLVLVEIVVLVYVHRNSSPELFHRHVCKL